MEARAGKNLSDAYLLSGFKDYLGSLKAMGLLLPYASPEREKVLAALKDSDGYSTGYIGTWKSSPITLEWYAALKLPKTWEDLLAPRWKSQIALEEERRRLVHGDAPAHGRRKRESFYAPIGSAAAANPHWPYFARATHRCRRICYCSDHSYSPGRDDEAQGSTHRMDCHCRAASS